MKRSLRLSSVVDPTLWNSTDRCVLWLGLVFSLFAFYVYRADYVLANPDVEIYFDRDCLRPLRSGLFAVTLATAVLFVLALAQRRRAPESLWIFHAANQIWWVTMSITAYAFGPVTSPILGLASLGGFISIQLFPRRVVVPALISGMTILVVTTIAAEKDVLPYAPLFNGPIGSRGKPPSVFLLGTAAASFVTMAVSFAFVSYLVERARSRELALVEAGANLSAARAELEQRIEERTLELSRSNELLTEEAAERSRIEEALRESETKLREQFTELELLYQHAPVGLCLQDNELRYVRLNERMAAINGQSVEAHMGRQLHEVVPGIDAAIGSLMRGVLDTGEPALDIEVHAATPADPDTERYWLTSYYPVKSSDGAVLGISSVVQDISELKWAEARARQHLESLAHVSRLSTMGQMATGIAHELNQPLAAMANYAYIGRRLSEQNGGSTSEAIRDVFDELSALALRAGGIVQHLRAFVNKAQMEREVTSVNPLIGGVLRLVGAELHAYRIVPVLTLDEALPVVLADTIQIQQVVLNLVRNAVEAMAHEDPSTRALVISSRSIAGAVEVAVRDTGEGLSAEDLDRVFDAFYTTKDAGMGMGLGISRSIIEDHGGRMWAETNRDKGATFRFTLPTIERHGATEKYGATET